ncbi:hypothetical protein B0H13DRAFT_2304268 [Mycena leptocephala]|nr:hypothetical protein B0H13DRAFT_2304268 [Mycena leptocephala]
MSLPALDIVTGHLLYTVEVIQAAYYYRHFKNDHWVLKTLVTAACTIDAVSMIGNYACVYLPVPLYVFSTGVVAALVQTFLVARYWNFTKNIFITLILSAFVTVAVGAAFASGVSISIYSAYKDRGHLRIPATIWLVAEAVTDISIAVSLLWEFWKVKPATLNRLAARTIQTGSAGAIIAFAALIAYLLNNQSNVPLGIAYCLGRVYILTMLANLNIRSSGRSGKSGGTGPSMGSSGGMPGTRGDRAATSARFEGEDEYGGIQLHQTALSMVRIDNGKDHSQVKSNVLFPSERDDDSN